jgi:hypothetical protein
MPERVDPDGHPVAAVPWDVFVMELVRGNDRAVNLRIDGLNDKLDLFMTSSTERFEINNRWRESIRDVITQCATKSDLSSQARLSDAQVCELRDSRALLLRPIENSVQDILLWRANMTGMATQESVNESRKESADAHLRSTISLIVGIGGFITGVVGILAAVLVN